MTEENKMFSAGSPLTDFITQIREQTEKALGDWELKSPVELELSVVTSGKVDGGIDIRVVKFGAKVEAEQVQKIKMSIAPKDEVAEAEKKARIATAKKTEELMGRKPFIA
ncbi:MAG: trypco2 family protein [Nanoarchaeota archaeon]